MSILQTKEGSTGRLIQLCVGYFVMYVITGVAVKYFQGSPADGLPGMAGMEFLAYSLMGGTLVNLVIIFSLGWWRMEGNQTMRVFGIEVPGELRYIIPSGVCTAVVVPTTTLMYSLPISVMVAMTMMRGSVIVISRVVDAIQIKQGILKKEVYWQENVAVVFALGAVGANFVAAGAGDFDFVSSPAAMIILSSYITAYAFRIYIMNYFKNTRAKGVKQDNKGFFALEQLSATLVMFLVATTVVLAPSLLGAESEQVHQFSSAVLDPLNGWVSATLIGGGAFGAVAVFSVFIFMFKGRTATFAGLVNRLTSLVAGTTATIIFALAFGGELPSIKDWVAFIFIIVAVGFLRTAERRRTQELSTEEA